MTYHNNQRFSTFDEGNVNNCSVLYKGSWWYKNCHNANLNGLYHKGPYKSDFGDGINWNMWKGNRESLEWTEIKIRPKHFRAALS